MWRRRFRTQGFEVLKDVPPIHKSHPQTTPLETVERIKELAFEHPAYGCNRVAALLALESRRVSAITIQKILNDNALGARYDRWLAPERANAEKAIELSGEQVAFLEKLNPCFRERHVESAALGELLSADTFFVGNLKGIGKLYLHAVVETPTAPMPSASCTTPSSLRPRLRSCITTWCRSTPSWIFAKRCR